MAYSDPIVEEVWKSREQLLEQYGGLEGFLEHIKKQEQEHPERLVTKEQLNESEPKAHHA